MTEKELEKEKLSDEKELEEKQKEDKKSADSSKKESKASKDNKKETKKVRLEDQLDNIQEELENFKDKYYRNLAEMENYKKRTSKELINERKYASQPLVDKLIDSLEVFSQALNTKTDDKAMQNFLYGFKMIKDMIFNALKDEGVSEIKVEVGDEFNPNIHEPMDTEYDPDKLENTILKVTKTGYKFKDRTLRPAFVIINIKPEKENKKENKKENREDE